MARMSPLCSRNARPRKGLVGCAQWGTHRGHHGNVNEQAWRNYCSHSLWPCLRNDVSWRVGAGWVRRLGFLSILCRVLLSRDRWLRPLSRLWYGEEAHVSELHFSFHSWR
jgi:hypothetical protein